VLTERLELRPLGPDDVDDVYAIMSDPDVWRHRPELVHTDPATSADWVARAAARWESDGLSYWGVRTRDSGRFIGVGGAQRQSTGNWNLHYRLAPSAWGRGYASELSLAAIEAARQLDDTVAVIAWIDPNNAASIRLAERIGLTRCGQFADPSDGRRRLAFTDRPVQLG